MPIAVNDNRARAPADACQRDNSERSLVAAGILPQDCLNITLSIDR